MRLYLHCDLRKADAGATKPDAGKQQERNAGQSKGGKYVARIQTGVAKDGSPQYEYFYNQEDYETYLRSKKSGKGEAPSKRLERKVKEEHARSTEAANPRVRMKMTHTDEKTEKSLYLFVRSGK